MLSEMDDKEVDIESVTQKVLEDANANGDIGIKEVDKVRDILRKTGAYEWAKSESKNLANLAKKSLEEGGLKKGGAMRRLFELADFLVDREY